MKKNKKAISIVLAIILTLIMGVIAIYLINYIIPFARNVKNIENVSIAYYQAQGGIERSLLFVKNNFGTNTGKLFSSGVIDYGYNITSLGNILPVSGKGNSEFDPSYNRLRTGEPIQLEVGKGYLQSNDWDNIEFFFRVPDLNLDGSLNEVLSGSNDYIIHWQLISLNSMLNASGSQITYNDINSTLKNGDTIFNGLSSNSLGVPYTYGINLDDTTGNFQVFYQNNCEGVNSGCILKMSIINKLELDMNNIPVPYLEWKIDLSGTSKNIPLRYAQIFSQGKSYGFKKEINVRVPQQTVNEAFDFTVFQ